MTANIVGFPMKGCPVMTRMARLPATSGHVLMSRTCLDKKENYTDSRSGLPSPPKLRISVCGDSISLPSESGSQTKFVGSFNSRKKMKLPTVISNNVCIQTIVLRVIRWCNERYELTGATKVSIALCCLMERSAGSEDALVACPEEMANHRGFLVYRWTSRNGSRPRNFFTWRRRLRLAARSLSIMKDASCW